MKKLTASAITRHLKALGLHQMSSCDLRNGGFCTTASSVYKDGHKIGVDAVHVTFRDGVYMPNVMSAIERATNHLIQVGYSITFEAPIKTLLGTMTPPKLIISISE